MRKLLTLTIIIFFSLISLDAQTITKGSGIIYFANEAAMDLYVPDINFSSEIAVTIDDGKPFTWDRVGSEWIPIDTKNDFQDLSLSGNDITLSDGGGTITIPSHTGQVVGSIDLSVTSAIITDQPYKVVEIDDLLLVWDNGGSLVKTTMQNVKDLVGDGTGTDDQNLSVSGDSLIIEDGNSIDLSSLSRPTDTLYVIAAGQSNMSGSGTGGDTTSIEYFEVWDSINTEWTKAHLSQVPFTVGKNNLAFHFCKNLVKNENKFVRLILNAAGGKKVESFQDGAEMNVMLTNQWTGSGSHIADVLLWHQGENNAGDTPDEYATSFNTVLSDLINDGIIIPTTKIVLGELYVSIPGVEDGLRQVAANSNYVGIMDDNDLESDDTIHFDGESLVKAGLRYYNIYKDLPSPDLGRSGALGYYDSNGNYTTGGILQYTGGILYNKSAAADGIVLNNASGSAVFRAGIGNSAGQIRIFNSSLTQTVNIQGGGTEGTGEIKTVRMSLTPGLTSAGSGLSFYLEGLSKQTINSSAAHIISHTTGGNIHKWATTGSASYALYNISKNPSVTSPMLFALSSSPGATVGDWFNVNSSGKLTLGTQGGTVDLGNYSFDIDQTVGSGQDNYVFTYDNGTGLISLEAAAGGGGGGDVTAASNLGDNLLIRGDGGTKGVQNSGISIDDSDNLTGIGNISLSGTMNGIDIEKITPNSVGSQTNGTIDFDSEFQYSRTIDMTGLSAITMTLSNPVSGGAYILHFTNADDADTVTWPSSVKTEGVAAVGTDVLSTGRRVVSLWYNGTNYILLGAY